MPRGKNQKLKLLYLAKIMLEETDDTHSLTMAQILDQLAAYDIEAQRKSIYDDIMALEDFGIEIIKEQVGKMTYYHVGSREFEIAELKLLVDAIQSSKFITTKKTSELIGKLARQASIYDGKILKREVYVTGRIKNMNESIYYIVDEIHNAMNSNSQITFRYYSWNVDGKAELRHHGKLYTVSPWMLLWDDENYYLIAYDEDSRMIRHYRVDKMMDIQSITRHRTGEEAFLQRHMASYSRTRFGMFDGREVKVTLLCENAMSNVIYDRFGKDIHVRKVDEEHFEVNVDVAVSDNFLGWIIGIGGVKITGPDSVVERMKDIAARLIETYM